MTTASYTVKNNKGDWTIRKLIEALSKLPDEVLDGEIETVDTRGYHKEIEVKLTHGVVDIY